VLRMVGEAVDIGNSTPRLTENTADDTVSVLAARLDHGNAASPPRGSQAAVPSGIAPLNVEIGEAALPALSR
jgi:hypothetical protein